MGMIPKYTSRVNPTSEVGTAMKKNESVITPLNPNSVDMNIGEQAGKNLADTSFKLKQDLNKIANANAKSKSDIDSTLGFSAIEDKVMANPEPSKAMDSVDNEISTIKQNAIKNFKDPIARDEYINDFDLKSALFKIGITRTIQKKEVDIGRVNTIQQMDLEASNYINAPDDAAKLSSRQKMSSIMDESVKLGLFSHEQGMDELNKMLNSADQATKDIKELNKRKEKELALAQKEAVNARENELVQLRVNKKEPIESLIKSAREDMNSGKVGPKFAEAYINSCKSPKVVGAKTKSAKFVGFVNDMIYNKVKPKDVEIALMEANTAGAITDEDFDLLVTFNQEVNQSNILEKMLPNISFAKGLQYWGDENAGARDESKQRMFRSYMDRIKQGIDPETASKESIKEETLTLFPQVKNAPKEGIDIIDKNGVLKHITPDGELTVIGKNKENK